MADPVRILARTLYPGDGAPPLPDRTIEVRDGRIAAIVPADELPQGGEAIRHDIVAPGFVDLQINGGGGVLFNDAPDVGTLERMAKAARAGGTTHILPTFITAPGTAYRAALDAVCGAIAAGVPGILGAHLEGPFLSPDRPGIHPPADIRPLTPEDCDALLAFPHPLLVTLAPERQEPRLVARLADGGVRVFAGHTQASAEEIAAAPGLTGLTHLWNAMSQPTGRAPGAVGAGLGGDLVAGIIADGIHVHPLNLAASARAMAGRLFLVTDAMATLAAPEARFEIGGVPIHFDGTRLVSSEGTLAGAHLAMDEAVRNMMRLAGVTAEAALDMAAGLPAKAMGLEERLGRIAVGREAHLACLDARFRARAVMVAGRWR